MKAAVVETFDRPPRYRNFDAPIAQADELIVSVTAAALSQLVRAQASGQHYTSGTPPMVPGADGVGSLSHAALIRSIDRLMRAVKPAGLTIEAHARPLTDVEAVWSEAGSSRAVLTL